MSERPSMRQRVVEVFERRAGRPPALVVRAPGRVNLIGEHTDYNDGFVLPMAIDRAVWMALAPRADRQVRLFSMDYDEEGAFDLDRFGRGGPAWLAYVEGVAWAFEGAGHRACGWDGVIGGDVPVGAGLSSSAAVEMATARALVALAGEPWDAAAMAQIGQRAERAWVGVDCGIMDQMISAAGCAGHALLIDCRSLATKPVPVPAAADVVVLDTGKRRALVSSAYNDRRAQCEAAARALGEPTLRSVTVEMLAREGDELPPEQYRRARHVVTENQRVLDAVAVMRAGDAVRLGQLMSRSHASLRDDFEVSCRELDTMVNIARARPGCHGARLTGAGFGGCAVALVAREHTQAFAAAVMAAYREATGLEPAVYVCAAVGGAAIASEEENP